MSDMRVLCLVGDGFEELELVAPVDVLRRAGVTVVIAALGTRLATGRNGMRLEADAILGDVEAGDFDLLLIPGGPGVAAMREDGRPAVLAAEFAAAGKWVAAICAAPLVLEDAGLLEGKQFTCFLAVREQLVHALDERVVVDGKIITSRGAGTAMDFGFALVAQLCGQEVAKRIASETMA